MLNFISSLIIAAVLGFLAGMGIGGGSLLLLWLTQVAMMHPAHAKILNLLFYIPAALAAILPQIKARRIEVKIILPGLIAGCLSAIIASLISRTLDVTMMKKFLGLLLLAVGLREIFYRPRNAR